MRKFDVINELLEGTEEDDIQKKIDPIDLHGIIKKMAANYVNLLLKERLANHYDLLCCLDMDGYFNYICPNHDRVIGYDAQELTGLHGFDIIHPGDIQKMQNYMMELTETKLPVEISYRIRHKKGHWIGMNSVCTPYVINDEVTTLINFSKPYLQSIN